MDEQKIPRGALLFMAAVDVARRDHQGALRALAPIFHAAFAAHRGRTLDRQKIADAVSPILGERFSEAALEGILPQFEQIGWLLRQNAEKGKIFYIVSGEHFPLSDDDLGADSLKKLTYIYSEYKRFIDETAPLAGFINDEDEFKWKLFLWCTSLDGSDKTSIIKKARELNDGFPLVQHNGYLDEALRFSKISKQESVEFAAFVRWLKKHDHPCLEDIASLSELGLAYEFLQEVRQPTLRKLDHITTAFILDGPVLLDYLGFSGPNRQASTAKCLDGLREIGGRIATIDHCLIEATEVVYAVLNAPMTERGGPVGDALRGDHTLANKFRAFLQRPDQYIKTFKIEHLLFEHTPKNNLHFFDDMLIDRFRNSATWLDSTKTRQRERDAKSVAYICRRRGGKISSDFLDTNSVFVTRNPVFSSFTKEFCRRHTSVAEYSASPVVDIKTLAAISWLRLPAVAEDEATPKLHLISTCDRILQSNTELLRKANQKLKEWRDQKFADAILSTQQSVFDLVIATGGDAAVLDAADTSEIMALLTREAESRGTAKERQRGKLTEQRLKTENMLLQEQIDEVTAKVAQISERAREQQLSIDRAEDERRSFEAKERERIEKMYQSISRKCHKTAERIVKFSWLLIIFVGAIASFLVTILGQNAALIYSIYGLSIVSSAAMILLALWSYKSAGRDSPEMYIQIRGRLEFHLILFEVEKIHLDDDRIAVGALARAAKGT